MQIQHTFSKVTYIYIACLAFILSSCANIVLPKGGPEDKTPPQILSITPSDSNKNIQPKKIEIRTNKYMEVKDLARYLTFSPVISVLPTVISYGKKIEIKIDDTLLQPNTTYKLSLGNALVDNRESTPIENFSYIFSTGSYFDSLEIKGKVIDVVSGKPDTLASVLLFDAATPDSAIATQKPLYYANVDASGNFNINLLPNKPFKIIAITDEDQNMLYAKVKESIGFVDSLVHPQVDYTAPLQLFTFKEVDTSIHIEATTKNKNKREDFSSNRLNNKKKDGPVYTVAVDTNVNERTFNVKEPLKIILNAPLSEVDQQRIYLSYTKNNVEAEAVTEIKVDSTQITLNTQWQEDLVYTLRLVKGWAKDTTGAEVLPSKYNFKTKSVDDYASLKINLDSNWVNANYRIVVINPEGMEPDTLLHQAADTNQYELKYLTPGNYQLYLYEDNNLDKEWSTGDFMLKLQPEKIYNHRQPIALRKGWTNEIDFIHVDLSRTGKSKSL